MELRLRANKSTRAPRVSELFLVTWPPTSKISTRSLTRESLSQRLIQIVFQILVKVLIGLEPGEEMDFLKHHFQEFIAGLISLPVKLPGSRLYRSLQASLFIIK